MFKIENTKESLEDNNEKMDESDEEKSESNEELKIGSSKILLTAVGIGYQNLTKTLI
jgi:hypothetical protein